MNNILCPSNLSEYIGSNLVTLSRRILDIQSQKSTFLHVPYNFFVFPLLKKVCIRRERKKKRKEGKKRKKLQENIDLLRVSCVHYISISVYIAVCLPPSLVSIHHHTIGPNYLFHPPPPHFLISLVNTNLFSVSMFVLFIHLYFIFHI